MICICAFCCGGCMMGPQYKRPALDLPAEAEPAVWDEFLQTQWWQLFEDETLNELEERALKNNQNLQAALARVEQARAAVGVAAADRWPVLNAEFSGGRQGDKNNSWQSTSQAGGALSFELDLWGKYRRLTQAARAEWMSSQATRDATYLTLTAEVATQYFNLRKLEEQIAIARRTWTAREENVRIYTNRYDTGYCSEVDLRRIEANRDSVRAQLYTLELQRAQAETALSVLVGNSPREMRNFVLPSGKKVEDIFLVPQVPEYLPSDLLSRRPDIVAAEENLRSANANIGAVRAAYFPSISLSAFAGYQSGVLNEIFRHANESWNGTGNVLAPLFAGGKIRAQNRKARAVYKEKLADYLNTVQTAFKEAADALAADKWSRAVFEAYAAQVQAMQRSYELTRKQADAGYIGVTDLLNVEETLLSAQMNVVQARTDELSALVNVCKAFGGGWRENGGFSAGKSE